MDSVLKRAAAIGALLAGMAAAGAAHADEASCKALEGRIFPASVLQYAQTGGKVTSAEWIAARPNFQAYCKVRGEISPKDPMATRTLWAVNLPETWNKKAVQFGGGGLNGTLVEGTGLLRDDPPGGQPLAKGYVTLGTDGGHPNVKPEQGVFMLNEEAEMNSAYGSNRNGHLIARILIQDYYKEKPVRFYFYGGSEGGRQALVAVQMFPKDYDGVVANVPSLNKTLQYIAKNNVWMATHDGGWMNAAKIKLLADATTAACDEMDGLKDGVISKYRGCDKVMNLEALRCPGGTDTGDSCLSDKQLAAVRVVRGRFDIGFPLKNGVQSLAPWSIGGEDKQGGYIDQIMAETEPTATDLGSHLSGNQFVRYAVQRNPTAVGKLDYQKYKTRILQLSNMSDMSNPDLSAFMNRGGKLIMKGNGADYQVGPESVFEYADNVTKKMGKAATGSFLRVYANPGVAHGGSGTDGKGEKIPDKVDLLGVLDAWVENGKAPGTLTVTAYNQGAPTATKPLCQVPTWPRYNGAGDPKSASSFTCTPF